MASIDLNLSQDTINTLHQGELASTGVGSGLSTIFDSIFRTVYNFAVTHRSFTSETFDGSNLTYIFPDGSSQTYFGVTGLNPQGSGTATATALVQYQPNYQKVGIYGDLHFSYTTASGNILAQGAPSTLTTLQATSLLPTYDIRYDKVNGNGIITIRGQLSSDSAANFTGSISSFTTQYTTTKTSSVIAGNFAASGNEIQIGQNLGHSSISGVVNKFAYAFVDGSYESITNATINLAVDQTFNFSSTIANADNFNGNDTAISRIKCNTFSCKVLQCQDRIST